MAEGLTETGREPLPAFQIENQSYLESAPGLPHQPYYGTSYSSLAAMVRSIAANHALVDGNKRLAVTVPHSTLLVNGFMYLWDNDDAVALALRCATGETSYKWLAAVVEVRSRPALPNLVTTSGDELRTAMEAQREALAAALAAQPDGWLMRTTISHHARGEMSDYLVSRLLSRRREAPAEQVE